MLLSKDTLLLVGDAQSDRAQLRAIFQQSYHLLEAENADQAVLLLNQNGSCIAAILMDLPIGNGETLPGWWMPARPSQRVRCPFWC
jgi:putative two-component system response regulator